MSEIYKSASGVVVWLGVEDYSSKRAFELMIGLITLPPEELSKLPPHDVHNGHENPLLDLRSWRSLARFFQRRWFNRAWIIQEVVFAKVATVLCGSHSVSWDLLVRISQFLATTSWTSFLEGSMHIEQTESATSQWHNTPARLAAARDTWMTSTNERLLYALIRARSSSCCDPRDKVYSQLGLGIADIFPEYESSVAEVYTTAAKYILENSRSLLLLTCAEGEEFQNIPGLPSWVPDWSVTKFLGLRMTGYRHYNAAGALPRQYSLSMGNGKHILSMEATKLDDVVEICDTKSDLRHRLHTSSLWKMISNLPSIYCIGESCEEAVWRSFVTNREYHPHISIPNTQPRRTVYSHRCEIGFSGDMQSPWTDLPRFQYCTQPRTYFHVRT